MVAGKVSFIPIVLFIGFLFVALHVDIVEGEAGRLIHHAAEGEAERLIYQGPCSHFPDCNKTCLGEKFPEGGKCIVPAPGKPLVCCCIG
ncbi:uncharacterized protein LOC131313406 [Rhododendron vialii]|uniref:uncharacterized protein LOC131313406 n=1 Tax=Rhododendron vialii TaxID=182163 RepID=UPI00265D9EA7|nr:uncharacterized protein LOC131313406 [Rhododendron vialii]